MKWSWDKLRHENRNGSKYSADCQVVSAVNAYHILTGKIAYKTERQYTGLCKLAKAIHGSAICIEKVWDRIGIDVYKYMWDLPKRIVCPIEATVWHKRYGFHSILIVDRDPKCDAVRIINFEHATTSNGWIFEEDLRHFIQINDRMSSWVDGHTYRSFRLK
ncbi:hypothetical protein LCGC14_3155010 [marine sediment metagenome]|uniref:Peptidase C39-like domain-containing protein n=1 Tax=marine sediment metagenome TaxID=412755 RepID=A0A0F8VSX7_9ZZZZ